MPSVAPHACWLRGVLLAGLIGACAPAPAEPGWQRLSPGHRPAPLAPLLARWPAAPLAAEARRFACAADGSLRVSLPLAARLLEDQGEGLWRLALTPLECQGEALELELEHGGEPGSEPGARVVPLPSRGKRPGAWIEGDRLTLRLPPGAPPPRTLTLVARFERPEEARALVVRADQELYENALALWPGERVELAREWRAGSELRFETSAQALLAPARVRFVVTLDGAPLAQHTETLTPSQPYRRRALTVPLGEKTGGTLAFAVEGEPAATAFVRPLLAPPPAARAERRPDVVLFLADTFRADLLAHLGGEPGLTPALDGLAARGVRFTQARSPATWTLPAHASLFTGTWPPQHGAEEQDLALAREFTTLAEFFGAAGYRTGAVTDGLYVAPDHGLAQGFQSFVVQRSPTRRTLEGTLAAADAFLEAEDGRPLFLFVHTYRTHWPYRADERAPAREAAGLRQRAQELLRERGAQGLAELAPLAAEMHALYRAGARDLDAQLAPWLARLEQRGLFERGLFAFTSDHGEEFLEHGGLEHSGASHEEVARVPLFLVGGSAAGPLAPREVALGASLVDLAPTLAVHCGLEPLAAWVGRDLLGLAEERLLFSSVREDGRRLLAVTRGPHKLLAQGEPELSLPADVAAAHDLHADPLEREDVLEVAAWPRPLAEAAAREWARIAWPLAPPRALVLDAAQLEDLRRLGYGD